MVKMEKEQNKNSKNNIDKNEKIENKDLGKVILIVIFSIIFLIIILMMISILSKSKKYDSSKNLNSIDIEVSQNEKIINFVNEYFLSRSELRFDKIFNAYHRDYVEEVINNNGDEIVTSIKYENSYIKSFENIKIYEAKGLSDGEYVLVISFDISLNYSDNKIPSLLVCYLYTEDENLYIKANLDVGDIKYVNQVLENELIKNLYENTKLRLENVLSSSESAKLAYNSLRQYDMNDMKSVNNDEKRVEKSIDPIFDNDYIYGRLKQTKKEEEKEEIFESIFGGNN